MQAVLEKFYGLLPNRKRKNSAEASAVQMLREELAKVPRADAFFIRSCGSPCAKRLVSAYVQDTGRPNKTCVYLHVLLAAKSAQRARVADSHS